jgi:hypothetical protein
LRLIQVIFEKICYIRVMDCFVHKIL